MKTNYLFNKTVLDVLIELWDRHDLPIEISYGKFENGLSEVSITCEDKDQLLIQWLIERATA